MRSVTLLAVVLLLGLGLGQAWAQDTATVKPPSDPASIKELTKFELQFPLRCEMEIKQEKAGDFFFPAAAFGLNFGRVQNGFALAVKSASRFRGSLVNYTYIHFPWRENRLYYFGPKIGYAFQPDQPSALRLLLTFGRMMITGSKDYPGILRVELSLGVNRRGGTNDVISTAGLSFGVPLGK